MRTNNQVSIVDAIPVAQPMSLTQEAIIGRIAMMNAAPSLNAFEEHFKILLSQNFLLNDKNHLSCLKDVFRSVWLSKLVSSRSVSELNNIITCVLNAIEAEPNNKLDYYFLLLESAAKTRHKYAFQAVLEQRGRFSNQSNNQSNDQLLVYFYTILNALIYNSRHSCSTYPECEHEIATFFDFFVSNLSDGARGDFTSNISGYYVKMRDDNKVEYESKEASPTYFQNNSAGYQDYMTAISAIFHISQMNEAQKQRKTLSELYAEQEKIRQEEEHKQKIQQYINKLNGLISHIDSYMETRNRYLRPDMFAGIFGGCTRAEKLSAANALKCKLTDAIEYLKNDKNKNDASISGPDLEELVQESSVHAKALNEGVLKECYEFVKKQCRP